jgi:hypothetical protein
MLPTAQHIRWFLSSLNEISVRTCVADLFELNYLQEAFPSVTLMQLLIITKLFPGKVTECDLYEAIS